MISRKHFQMIANELRESKPLKSRYSTAQWELDVESVAKALSKMNPRFDMNRFIETCGIEKEKEPAAA
jgi:hypothetical protein